MTKTYLTRDEAFNFYGLNREWFDLFLPTLDVRRIGDRMHRDDVAKLAARFDLDNDEEAFFDDPIEAANDNCGVVVPAFATVCDDGEESGLSVTLSSY